MVEVCAISVPYWKISVGYWGIRLGYWEIRVPYGIVRAKCAIRAICSFVVTEQTA